jgi:hypothetical protein
MNSISNDEAHELVKLMQSLNCLCVGSYSRDPNKKTYKNLDFMTFGALEPLLIDLENYTLDNDYSLSIGESGERRLSVFIEGHQIIISRANKDHWSKELIRHTLSKENLIRLAEWLEKNKT